MKVKILILHLVALALAIMTYKNLFEFREIYFDSERGQFEPYITQSNCDGDFKEFTYCIIHKGENPVVLVGDSSILAVAKNVREPLLALGSGSCPVLLNFNASYSSAECMKLSEKFHKMVVDGKIRSNHWIIAHRSDYLEEITKSKYKKSILQLFADIKKLNPLAKVDFIIDVPTLVHSVTDCKPRGWGIHDESCMFKTQNLIDKRIELLGQTIGYDKLIIPNFEKVRELSSDCYRDAVHISSSCFKKMYPTFEKFENTPG